MLVNPLDLIRAKLTRAEAHVHELQREFAAFAESHPLPVGFTVDFNSGWCTAYFDETARTPPPLLNVLAGEVVYQARSSLEHLVWALVRSNHKKPGRDHTFPIRRKPVGTKGLTDKQAFIESTKRKQLEGVPMQAIALIEKLQPYNVGDRPDYVLTILNEMARNDRHRSPPSSFVSGDPAALAPLFKPVGRAQIVQFKPLLSEHRSIVLGKTKIARLKIEPLSRQPKVCVDGGLPALIAFGERDALLTLPALYSLSTTVRQIVSLFERFL